MNRPRITIAMAALTILLVSTGCAQVAYDSMRQNQSMNCQQLQGTADKDDCMRRSEMSYDEYQRQLNRQKQER